MQIAKWDFVKKRLAISHAELQDIQAALSEPGRSHGERVVAALVAGGLSEDAAFCVAVTSGMTGEPITFTLRYDAS